MKTEELDEIMKIKYFLEQNKIIYAYNVLLDLIKKYFKEKENENRN